MAWGYWTAHTLAPSRSRPRSLSPSPGPMVRSRDHSLDRDRAANIGKLCHTPESGGSTRCSGHSGGEQSTGHSHSSTAGGHSNHVSPDWGHQHSPGPRDRLDWAEASGHRPDRTKDRDRDPQPPYRDRNTLPRVKMETDGSQVSSSGHGSGPASGGAGPGLGSVMVETRHTLPRGRTECESHGWPEPGTRRPGGTKASSEGEPGDWCPGCNNASCPVSNVSSCR